MERALSPAEVSLLAKVRIFSLAKQLGLQSKALMAALTVNIPAIVLNGGPMLNGWSGQERVGSGTVIWRAVGGTWKRTS